MICRAKSSKSPRLAISSEGDAFRSRPDAKPSDPLEWVEGWIPENPEERVLLSLWEEGMKHFRNWEGHRERGEPFSETKVCWMPAARLDDEPTLILAAEFGAQGNELNDREGLPRAATLRTILRKLVAGQRPPEGVKVDVLCTAKAYYELVVTATSASVDEAITYAKRLSEEIVKQKTLAHAHEHIG